MVFITSFFNFIAHVWLALLLVILPKVKQHKPFIVSIVILVLKVKTVSKVVNRRFNNVGLALGT